MQFRIWRTSDYYGEYPPCKDAIEGEVEYGVKLWYIHFNNLKDLLSFVEEEGQVILNKINGEWELEIYDTHRE